MKVLIDPGHSLQTTGKISPDGSVKEYLFARELATAVERKLRQAGIDVERIITPEEDDNIDISSKERADRIYKTSCREECLLVSLHSNMTVSDGKWHNGRGWSIYVDRHATDRSRLLAFLIAGEAGSEGLKVNKPDDDSQFLCWETDLGYGEAIKDIPAVLIKSAYLDNKDDVKYICSEIGVKSLSDIIVRGISNYLIN